MTELCGPITSTTPGDDLKSVGKIVASTELKVVEEITLSVICKGEPLIFTVWFILLDSRSVDGRDPRT